MFFARNRLFVTETFRDAALYAVLSAISMTVLIAIIYLLLGQSFKANLLREIDGDITAIRTAYVTAKPGKALHEAQEMIEDRMLARDEDEHFLLERGQTRIAGDLPPMPFRLGEVTFAIPSDRKGPPGPDHRMILGRGVMLAGDIYAFSGRNLAELHQTEDYVFVAFICVLLASLVVTAVGAASLSRRFLKRIDAVTRTCRGIMAGHLSERIPVQSGDGEFARLGVTINDMLDRIEALLTSLRQVSTDIAHDLRTPLTHLRQRLERVHRKARTAEEYAVAVEAGVEDCDNLLRIFSALLRISQIEAKARRKAFQPVDLRHLVETAHEVYLPAMNDTGHLFSMTAQPVTVARGDEELLLQLVSNLLDNAIAHTPAGSEITLWCGIENGCPQLIVADRGPGVPYDERSKVLQRFYRCEQSRTTPGSGLGLSLVAAIADLHQGLLSLEDNAPGLRVRVQFPAAAKAFVDLPRTLAEVRS